MIETGTTRDLTHDGPLTHFHCERLNEAEIVLDFVRDRLDATQHEPLDAFRKECREHDLFYEVTPGPVVQLFTDREADDGVIISFRGEDAVQLLRELWSQPNSGARWISSLVRDIAPRTKRR